MKKCLLIIPASLLLFLASCQTEATGSVPTPTAASPTPVIEPTFEEVVQVDYCVECHTDKDQLISTAKPEEVVEEESSGVG